MAGLLLGEVIAPEVIEISKAETVFNGEVTPTGSVPNLSIAITELYDNIKDFLVVTLEGIGANTQSISSITYNSVALTLAVREQEQTNYVEIYYLNGAAQGQNTIEMLGSYFGGQQDQGWRMRCFSIAGANLLGNIAKDKGLPTASLSASVATTSGSLVLGAMAKTVNEAITTDNGIEESNEQLSSRNGRAWTATALGDGGIVTIGASWSTANVAALVIAELKG